MIQNAYSTWLAWFAVGAPPGGEDGGHSNRPFRCPYRVPAAVAAAGDYWVPVRYSSSPHRCLRLCKHLGWRSRLAEEGCETQ